MFNVLNLSQAFRIEKHQLQIFSGLNFQIEDGQWIALTGPSGCGKTSLLHLLAGLARPQSGDIYFNELCISKLSSHQLSKWRQQEVGFIFQAFNLFPELNALENVMLPGIICRQGRQVLQSRATELLEQVGLGERLKHRPAELSGGEQQRVAIARALLNRPSILFADEPTGNLDDQNTAEVLRILQDQHQTNGITLVMVTHQNSVAHLADRVLKLQNQSIFEESLTR